MGLCFASAEFEYLEDPSENDLWACLCWNGGIICIIKLNWMSPAFSFVGILLSKNAKKQRKDGPTDGSTKSGKTWIVSLSLVLFDVYSCEWIHENGLFTFSVR